MKTLTIGAATLESGSALRDALEPFDPELIEDEDTGSIRVVVALGANNDVFEVLSAIADYLRRKDGGAGSLDVDLDGSSYALGTGLE